jgi:hypothetical protein
VASLAHGTERRRPFFWSDLPQCHSIAKPALFEFPAVWKGRNTSSASVPSHLCFSIEQPAATVEFSPQHSSNFQSSLFNGDARVRGVSASIRRKSIIDVIAIPAAYLVQGRSEEDGEDGCEHLEHWRNLSIVRRLGAKRIRRSFAILSRCGRAGLRPRALVRLNNSSHK